MTNTHIAGDTVLPIEVSAGFYERIGRAAEHLILTNCTTPDGEIDLEKVKEANKQIETDTIKDEWLKHYETLLIFIYEFERQAELHGKVIAEEELSEVQEAQ